MTHGRFKVLKNNTRNKLQEAGIVLKRSEVGDVLGTYFITGQKHRQISSDWKFYCSNFPQRKVS